MNQESSEESSNSQNLLLKEEKFRYPYYKAYFNYPDSYILMQDSEIDRVKRILKIVEENYAQPIHKKLTMAQIHRKLHNIPKNVDYRSRNCYITTAKTLMLIMGLKKIYKHGELVMDGPFLMLHDTHLRRRARSNLSRIKTARYILPWHSDYKM